MLLETDGGLVLSYPFLNQRFEAVEAMLDDPLVTLGIRDATGTRAFGHTVPLSTLAPHARGSR